MCQSTATLCAGVGGKGVLAQVSVSSGFCRLLGEL